MAPVPVVLALEALALVVASQLVEAALLATDRVVFVWVAWLLVLVVASELASPELASAELAVLEPALMLILG